jgi:hypothetical protein
VAGDIFCGIDPIHGTCNKALAEGTLVMYLSNERTF